MPKEKTVRETMTRRQKLHHYYLCDPMQKLQYDLHSIWHKEDAIPAAWQDIATEPDTPKKQSITLRVDADVLKFFRSTGRGYQTRMNNVLRAFMEAKLSGMIQTAARFEKYVNDEDYEHRPLVGDMGRLAGEMRESSVDGQIREETRAEISRLTERRRQARIATRKAMARSQKNRAERRKMAEEARKADRANGIGPED